MVRDSILPRRYNRHFRKLFDSDARHAIAIHLHDRVTPAVVFHRIADAWDVPEAKEQKPCQGFETGIRRNALRSSSLHRRNHRPE